MIKNILFDLDNTLFDFTASEKKALTKTLIHLRVEPTEEMLIRYSQINLAHWKLLEQGKLTRDQVKTGRYRQFFEEYGIIASPEETTRFYEQKLAEEGDLTQGAYDILTLLQKDYNLFVVSNGTLSAQLGRLKNTGITKFFKDLFISQTIGYEKPAKEFFDYCFNKIKNFKKEETIIVGDSISADIIGGIKAGIKTVWFNPKQEKSDIKAHYEISALAELENIILKENENA